MSTSEEQSKDVAEANAVPRDDKQKLVEFRDNNRRLLRALGAEDIESAVSRAEALAGIDPIEHAQLKTQLAELDGLKAALEGERRQREVSERALGESRFDSGVAEAALRLGARLPAVKYLAEKARATFEYKDGKVQAKADKFSETRPGEHLSLDEWLLGATKTYEFAFHPSTGGGAGSVVDAVAHAEALARQGLPTDPHELGRASRDRWDREN